jgi:hypothetical protein
MREFSAGVVIVVFLLAALTGCGPASQGQGCSPQNPNGQPGISLSDGTCADGLVCVHGDNGSVGGTCLPPQGAACDPASDDPDQCGAGLGCSIGSNTCIYVERCLDDGACAPQACHNGWCLSTCTANALPCAEFSSCDLTLHVCK